MCGEFSPLGGVGGAKRATLIDDVIFYYKIVLKYNNGAKLL